MSTKRAHRRTQESAVGGKQFQYRVAFGRRPLALAAHQVRKLRSERHTSTNRLWPIGAVAAAVTIRRARTFDTDAKPFARHCIEYVWRRKQYWVHARPVLPSASLGADAKTALSPTAVAVCDGKKVVGAAVVRRLESLPTALLTSISAHLDYVDLSQGWARVSRALHAVALLPAASSPRMTVPQLIDLSERDAHVRVHQCAPASRSSPTTSIAADDLSRAPLPMPQQSSSSSSSSSALSSSPFPPQTTIVCRGFPVWPRALAVDGGDAAENDWNDNDYGDAETIRWRARSVRSTVQRLGGGGTLYSFLDVGRLLPVLERLEWRNALACDLDCLTRAAPGARRLRTLVVTPRGTSDTDACDGYAPPAEVHASVWLLAAALPALTDLETTARLDVESLASLCHASPAPDAASASVAQNGDAEATAPPPSASDPRLDRVFSRAPAAFARLERIKLSVMLGAADRLASLLSRMTALTELAYVCDDEFDLGDGYRVSHNELASGTLVAMLSTLPALTALTLENANLVKRANVRALCDSPRSAQLRSLSIRGGKVDRRTFVGELAAAPFAAALRRLEICGARDGFVRAAPIVPGVFRSRGGHPSTQGELAATMTALETLNVDYLLAFQCMPMSSVRDLTLSCVGDALWARTRVTADPPHLWFPEATVLRLGAFVLSPRHRWADSRADWSRPIASLSQVTHVGHPTLVEVALDDYTLRLGDLFRFADARLFPRLECVTSREFRCAVADLRAVPTASSPRIVARNGVAAEPEATTAAVAARRDPDGVVTRHWVATLIREWAHPTQPCRSSLLTFAPPLKSQ